MTFESGRSALIFTHRSALAEEILPIKREGVCVCVRKSYVLLSFDPLVCELNGFQVLKMQLHESVDLQKRANEG